MSKLKLIIHVVNGTVQSVMANMPLEYSVVEENSRAEQQICISDPNPAEIVLGELSLRAIPDPYIRARAERDFHPWY